MPGVWYVSLGLGFSSGKLLPGGPGLANISGNYADWSACRLLISRSVVYKIQFKPKRPLSTKGGEPRGFGKS